MSTDKPFEWPHALRLLLPPYESRVREPRGRTMERHLADVGDAVDVEMTDDGMLKLMTEDGILATNAIYLDPEVLEVLLQYVADARKRSAHNDE